MRKFTERQQRCLDALATYQYLTTQQMVRLGLSCSRSHVIDRVLNGIRQEITDAPRQAKRRLIGRCVFGSVIGHGRLFDLYYLTKIGAETVAQRHGVSVSQLRYPKRPPQFVRDYHHRVAFIDAHIALVAWAKTQRLTIIGFHRYFDCTQNRVSNTFMSVAGVNLIPDGCLTVQTSQQQELVYYVEVHLGSRPAEIVKQLRQYESNLLTNPNTFVVSVFEHDKTRTTVETRLSKNSFRSQVHMITLSSLIANWMPTPSKS